MDNIIQKIIKTNVDPIQDIFSLSGKIYTFLNPVSYIEARKRKAVYNAFDGMFADGAMLVLFIRLLYKKRLQRLSFDMTSVAPLMFDYAQENRKTIYLLGSERDIIERAVLTLKRKYPNIQIAGYRSGFFNSENERKNVILEICNIKPDFLIVGMGAPKQEYFLQDAKMMGFTGVGFTCGGFIHQIANNEIDYYPKWINKYNLRFAYRIYKEKHTRKRYLYAFFIFPILFAKDRFVKS